MPSATRALQTSWSTTLRLPRSSFPPLPILGDRPKYLRKCTDDLYAWQRTAETLSADPPFLLHDGPPYANGPLHIGHALNKILKDVTCRYHVSKGRRVDWVPGWDCHGLPIELKALQRQGGFSQPAKDRQMGAIAVRKAARQLAQETIAAQKAAFRKWAVMADWDNAWTTMDKDFELRQLAVFRAMLGKGLVYRKYKPVYWSPSSRTALAEAELEYHPRHVSHAAFVKFSLTSVPAALEERLGDRAQDIGAVIWTTTPWTLPANKIIAVHADLPYVLVESARHGRLLVAKSRVSYVEGMCGDNFTACPTPDILGAELIGATFRHPLVPTLTAQPVVHAEFVSANSGSGLVHVAPGHGMDDYKLGLQYGIEPYAPLDDFGCFTDEAMLDHPEILAGKAVLKDGNRAVLDHLQMVGSLLVSHKYVHSYPYDWRSREPVIVRATAQWFADVGEIREAAIQAIGNIDFVPKGGKERLLSFVQNRTEWCISRQRAWGVPIPALYREDDNEALLSLEIVSHVMTVIEKRGVDAWWTDDEFDQTWVPPALRGGPRYRRGRDTMDVWFDSGTSWTHMGANANTFEPRMADMYLEGTDQHRGWFQSSLLTKVAFQSAVSQGVQPSAPYKMLVTHGFVLDRNGRKMSKSEGNVTSPDQIIDATLLTPIKRKNKKGITGGDQSPPYGGLGPDALRLWAAGCDYTKDVQVGQPVLKAVNSSLLKLRVTFRLLTGLLADYRPNVSVPNRFSMVDHMARLHLRKLKRDIWRHYEEYEWHKGLALLNQYVSVNLSAFYIESIKDRLYADAPGSESRKNAQAVLFEIFQVLTNALAPITPLLVEEACDYLPAHLAWDPVRRTCSSISDGPISGFNNVEWDRYQYLEEHVPFLTALDSAVKWAQENSRTDKKMGSSLQSFVLLDVQAPAAGAPSPEQDLRAIVEKYATDLVDFFVVSDVKLSSGPLPEAVTHAEWAYSQTCEMWGQTVVVHVYAPQNDKCVRCWKYTVPPNQALEDALCKRCVGVLEGMREEMPEIFAEKPLLDEAARKCREGQDVESLGRHWHFA